MGRKSASVFVSVKRVTDFLKRRERELWAGLVGGSGKVVERLPCLFSLFPFCCLFDVGLVKIIIAPVKEERAY